MHTVCLLDCNNFFVSCERLFRPDLKTVPVVVLSSNDGCVVARSEEAKRLGIPMGIPYYQIQKECAEKRITVFSSNFTLYRDISRRVMETLSHHTESCEIYSIDEAFFTYLSHVQSLDDVVKIRCAIQQETGIPVSIGISATKTLAKIANHTAKKTKGITFLDPKDLLTNHGADMVSSVWGIGRNSAARLREIGVVTIADLLASHDRDIKRAVGIAGVRIRHELLGVQAHGVISETYPTSITSTRSFGATQRSKEEVMGALAYHVSMLGERLRRENLTTQQVHMFIAPSRHGDFAYQGKSAHTEIDATQSTGVLLGVVRGLLQGVWRDGVPYARAGVTLSSLLPRGTVTGSLFGDAEIHTVRTSIDTLVDQVNARIGDSVLQYGTARFGSSWHARHNMRSPNYTTQWREIPTIRLT